ncbi:MAG: glycerol-3-phosphate acyltransferase [Anaerolineae bacterium]|nr:glycerol-3-phosphate acyltransferase [Anaerolineae bacterium]
MLTALLMLIAYLLGSIPTAYLAGRWLRNIDIRQYGTGNVGGSNVWESVACWAVVPVGLFDICKAALPAWLALSPLDLGYPVAVVAGLCAALGHTWSLYLGFTGGRALSSILGTLAVVFPWGALIQLLVMGVGFVLHIELLTTLGLLALPFLSLAFGRPPAVTWGCVAMIVLIAIKRVEANRTPLPPGTERRKVIWRRLWLDRDVSSHEEWVARRPAEAQPDEGRGNAG